MQIVVLCIISEKAKNFHSTYQKTKSSRRWKHVIQKYDEHIIHLPPTPEYDENFKFIDETSRFDKFGSQFLPPEEHPNSQELGGHSRSMDLMDHS